MAKEIKMPKFYHAVIGTDDAENDILSSGYGLRRRLHLSDAAAFGGTRRGLSTFRSTQRHR